ncbi:MAG: TolC family protein [Gemmatimonadales bacterium]|nr:TolC family protein [Gemmatimonadales bacterium]
MRKLALAGLSLLLGACGLGAAPRSPAPRQLQPGFQNLSEAPPEAAAPAAFWRTLGDSTLIRLLGGALQNNLDVRVAESRVLGARSARLQAALDLAPTITTRGGYTRQRLSGAGFPGFGGAFPDQDVWDAGVEASWEIDVFGRLRRNLQGEGALVASAREGLRDVQILLAAELATTYFELRGAQSGLAVAERNAENQRRSLRLTRQRLDAGRGTPFDTERASAQLNSTLAAIPLLHSRIASAQYQIGVLVGRAPGAVAPELATRAAPPALPASLPVVDSRSFVLQRPDVVSAERLLAAQSAFVGSARSEYLPRLDLFGSAGLTATTFDSLGKSGASRYAVGPVISWPALNLGRVKARVDAARARQSEARARYEQTVLRAASEVETSLVTYRTAGARLAFLGDAAEASERAADLARLRFEGGVADFLQVLDAQRTVLEAQSQLEQGRTEATMALVAVYRALGGSWPAGAE